jgi:hypothetical protein
MDFIGVAVGQYTTPYLVEGGDHEKVRTVHSPPRNCTGTISQPSSTDLRPLAEQNPAAYLPTIAATLNSTAILDRKQNRIEEARQKFNQALDIYVRLAEENPAGTLRA